jgi:hypothetical protein
VGDIKSKRCRKCGQVKPLSAFYSQQDTKGHVANICKSCVNKKVGRWQKEHKAQVNAKNRAYYHEHGRAVKAQIFLEDGQTQEEAEELLLKALGAQHRGDTHSHDFPDPGVDHVAELMKRKHQEMLERLMKEITEILEMK